MDQTNKLSNYRRILQQVIEMHAAMPGEPEDVESVAVCDSASGNYLLMDIFPNPKGSAAHVVIHLRLKEGKVRIERDGIEYGVAQDLIEAGIAEEDIAYTFYSKEQSLSAERAAA